MIPAAKVLFRPDSGPQIGMGHLQRCLSLAAALHQSGTGCTFLSNGERYIRKHILDQGFEILEFLDLLPGSDEDLKSVLKVAADGHYSAVVIDSYHVGKNYLEQLRLADLLVVAIDDLARYPFPCQLVVNGATQAPSLPYCTSSGDTKFLLGSQYALLRPEFWNVSHRTTSETVRNILITLGGADYHNLMPKLLAMVDDLPGTFTVTAIVGPFFPNREEVKAVASSCRRVVRLAETPESVRTLMLEADLAISAGGQTLYELASIGTPTVAVAVAPNQAGNLQALAAKGVIHVAGAASDATLLGAVESALRRLLGSHVAQATMSVAGPRLVDGRGAIRVAEVMTALGAGSSAGLLRMHPESGCEE